MPIEFRCPSCSKLLRTPDESAGKKAKCPQCGGIADVPLASSGPPAGGSAISPGLGEPLAPIPPVMPTGVSSGQSPGKISTSPFAEAMPTNPYASPAAVQATPTAQVSRGTLIPTRISFDRIFESVWAVYKPVLGQMAVLGLVILLTIFALIIIGQVVSLAVQQTREPVIIHGFTVVNQLLGMLVQAWIGSGTAIFMLKAVRNEAPSLNDLGQVGPFFVRAALLQLLVALVTYSIIAVCLAPAGILYFVMDQQRTGIISAILGGVVAAIPVTYVSYRWLLATYFIVDRNLGVMESLAQSSIFMAGNKLIAFLILLVVVIGGTIFSLLTCCIGYVLLFPYIGLTMTVIYLSATGQLENRRMATA